MTFIPVAFDEVVEPAPLPASRYPTQITAAEVKQTGPNSKNPGRDMLVFTIGFTGPSKEEQNAPTINHFVSLPHPDDEAKAINFKSLALKRFLVAYGIPFDNHGIDTDTITYEAIGREAFVEVTLDKADEGDAVYNRLRLPRLPSEN